MTNAEDHKQSFGDSINASLGDNAKNVIVGKGDQINTGGGADIQGDANTHGGDFVNGHKYQDNSVNITNIGSIGKLNETLGVATGIGAFRKIVNAWADGKVQRMQAQANADAKIISLKGEMDLRELDMRHRAMNRIENLELRRQSNLDEIRLKAIPFLPSSVSSEPVNEDWVFMFVENSQDISDEQMQEVWARILAGEVAQPGSFSKRTLQTIKLLSANEAQLFARCCTFVWGGENAEDRVFPIIFIGGESEFIRPSGLTFTDLQTLQSAGLMMAGVYSVKHHSNLYHIEYFGTHYRLTINPADPFQFGVGNALFSEAGKELLRIVKSEPDREYERSVIEHWEKHEKIKVEKLI